MNNKKFKIKIKEIIQYNMNKLLNLVFKIEKRINFTVQKQF